MNQTQLRDFITENQPNICQIAAWRDGKFIYSQEWNGYADTDCTHIMSATKSVVALLVGIAIDQGLIHSIDDKVLDFFPEYQVKRGEKTIQEVKLRHLLTMRAPYKGKGDPWSKVCTSLNWTHASLDFLGGRKGLTDEFQYQTVCLHILSGILWKATGKKTVDFANEYLFKPLGIAMHENYYAKSAEEHRYFTIDKEPKGNVWFADRDGLGTPGYGLCMSAKDMAKLGMLCLNKGVWEGKQILSAAWIDEMTRPRAVEGKMFRGMAYGYLWWIIHPEKKIYAAIGNSGNVIYVNPEKNVVVAVSSYFKPTIFDRVDFIEAYVVPMLESMDFS
ncbi:MAG: beta-lactamase family protein [Acetatifactor sp.]|nr:beta-lactamase family protein [Acetatifactor sp.]